MIRIILINCEKAFNLNEDHTLMFCAGIEVILTFIHGCETNTNSDFELEQRDKKSYIRKMKIDIIVLNSLDTTEKIKAVHSSLLFNFIFTIVTKTYPYVDVGKKIVNHANNYQSI